MTPDRKPPTPSKAKRVYGNVGELKTNVLFPGTFLRVLEVIDDEHSDRFTLAKVIAGDPALSEQVIAAANSPLYLTYNDRVDRSPPPVANLPVAVLKLGFTGVRNIACAQSLCQLAGAGHGLGLEILAHLLVVAETARGLGLQFSRALGEDAYFAGLMHDFGKLVLLRTLPQEYLEVAALCRTRGIPAREAERELLAPVQPLLGTHLDAGAALLRAHRIPREIVSAVEGHHDAPGEHILGTERWDLTGVVIAADRMAYHVGYADGLFQPAPAQLELEDLTVLLGRDAHLLNDVARDAVARAQDAISVARLPVEPRELRRIGEVQSDAGLLSGRPRETSSLYAGVMILLDMAREGEPIDFDDLLARTRLERAELEGALDCLLGNRYLEERPGAGGARSLAATSRLVEASTQEVLAVFAGDAEPSVSRRSA